MEAKLQEKVKEKWNKEQKLAIEATGKNILVSAAAGSGKTAVLVERIKRKILVEKVPIKELFVATFTEAAANEMKEKIRNSLKKTMEESNADKKYLKEQLRNISNAQIGTFHSFCANVIRRNFQLVGLEPNFKVCDEIEAKILKDEVMETLLDSLYEESSPEFYAFLDAYCGDKDESKFKKLILNNYDKLMSLPDPFSSLEEFVEKIRFAEKDFYNSGVYKFLMNIIFMDLYSALKISNQILELLDQNCVYSLEEKIFEEHRRLDEIFTYVKSNPEFDQIGKELSFFTFERMTVKKSEKDDYEPIKQIIKKLRDEEKKLIKNLIDTYFSKSLDKHIYEIKYTLPLALEFKNLLTKYHQLYSEAKRKDNLIDFNDMEQMALQILFKDEIADECKKMFKYVFVDEYQDTNYVQEEIIKRISNDNNLFLVGDVKQSIYGFRGAIPQIFEDRYQDYKQDNENSMKIDLNYNYRSTQNVIDSVNLIFTVLMWPFYDEDVKLKKGSSKDEGRDNQTEIHVVEGGKTNDNIDETLAELKDIELEALHVGKIIHNLIRKSNNGERAKTEYKDIVILLKTIKGKAEIYYNALMKDSESPIPAYIDDNEGYFDTIEIDNFMSLLSIIDNKKQDIPLITVLKSEIFGFSIDELIEIRTENSKGKYYEAFLNYSKTGKIDELKDKCVNVLNKIKDWKIAAKTMPLDDFIWDLLIQTNFYLTMGGLPGGPQRQGNLRILVDKAKDYLSMKTPSLSGFIKYIDIVKQSNVKIGQVKLVNENDNVVRIMSIHKSKGLQFPVVIVGELGASVQSDPISDIDFQKDLGLGLKLVDTKNKFFDFNIISQLIKRRRENEQNDEALRIYYVALTRAEEKLILVGTTKNFEEIYDKHEESLFGAHIISQSSTLIDNLIAILRPNIKPNFVKKNEFIISDEKSDVQNKLKLIENLSGSSIKITPKIKDNLTYSYPYKKASETKLKYSVSELNKKEDDEKLFDKIRIKKPNFLSDKHKFSNAELGTIYHRLMEEIDFAKMDCEEEKRKMLVEDTLKQMEKNFIFNSEEIQSIDIEKAIEFFDTDIGKRAVKAAKNNLLHKEKDFIIKKTKLVADGGTESKEEILVQGIIDCFFEENGEYVLIDYKTNYIDAEQDFNKETERIVNEYSKQIQLYVDAINKSLGGKVKEAYLYLQAIGKEVPVKVK